MADLIRWTDNGYGGFLGYVGTLDSWLYQIWDDGARWVLQPATGIHLGMDNERYGDSPDELKARAEELLREFASSLGAVFPDGDRWQALKDWLGELECAFRPDDVRAKMAELEAGES